MGATAFLALGAWVVSSSCRGVVAGDEIDLGAEICAQLDACYDWSDCDLGPKLEPSGAESSSANFMSGFAVEECFGSCSQLSVCVNESPLCEPAAGAACSFHFECCGWKDGQSLCGEGECCRPDGVACEGASDCCNENCVEGACGGYLCVENGGACTDLSQCCTKTCVAGTCVEPDCSGFGSPCAEGVPCCATDETGAPLVCSEGFCRLEDGPTCSSFQEPCLGDEECCADQGLSCRFDTLTMTGVCSDDFCPLQGEPCLTGNICCGNLVCTPEGSCQPIANCLGTAEACTQNEECCSLLCTGGKCRVQDLCLPHECHGVCQFGAPLDPANAGCNYDNQEVACLQAILAVYPECGCQAWDAHCICAAEAECGIACPFDPGTIGGCDGML